MSDINKIEVYESADILLVKRAELDVTLVKALINLGREGSVDIHENPVLHCMSIVSPVVVVALLAVTAFHHFKKLQFFPTDSCPSFRIVVYKNKGLSNHSRLLQRSREHY